MRLHLVSTNYYISSQTNYSRKDVKNLIKENRVIVNGNIINKSDIKVNPEWRKTKIGQRKFERKLNYWYKTGELESKILLDRDFNLVDGYSSVRIAEIKHINKVPVYFIN